MALKLNFRRFANEKTASCSPFIAFAGLKHNEFFYLKWLGICIFEKIIGQKSEGKNINKIEKY